jgi:methylisocitrate lyase
MLRGRQSGAAKRQLLGGSVVPYLVSKDLPRDSAGKRFRALMDRHEILQLPGAHNGMAALQAKAAGFHALYLSGAAMSASMGLPDLGIITIDDVTFFLRQIVRAAELPVLVDGDTGHGEVLNVMNTVRTFEDAGAGAVHLEDQSMPKKCGQLNGKHLVDPDQMAAKIAAATRARRDLIIVARTDAVAVEGVDSAITRAKRYVAAGADAIFVEALTSKDTYRKVATALRGTKLLVNLTEFGVSPNLTASELQELGYRMVIWPVSSLRVANKAQSKLYGALRRDGTTHAMLGEMQTRAELYEIVRLHDYEALDTSIVETELPKGFAA